MPRRFLLAAALAAVATPSPAQTVDQSQTTFNSSVNIDLNGQIGQSFTPTASSLGFARLYLADDISANGLGATFNVRVRQGAGFGGTVLGTSSNVAFPNGFGGAVAEFNFTTALALNPGNVYTLELQKVSGDSFSIFHNSLGGYSGGNAFFNGTAFSGNDLYFQEGFTPVPESASVLGVAAAGLGLAGWVRRRRAVAAAGAGGYAASS